LDLANFREDLVCALGRPEEWQEKDNYLIHVATGTRVYPGGGTFGALASSEWICTVPVKKIDHCRREIHKRINDAANRCRQGKIKKFLDSFPGFRS